MHKGGGPRFYLIRATLKDGAWFPAFRGTLKPHLLPKRVSKARQGGRGWKGNSGILDASRKLVIPVLCCETLSEKTQQGSGGSFSLVQSRNFCT